MKKSETFEILMKFDSRGNKNGEALESFMGI
jgi:hypothetical protein